MISVNILASIENCMFSASQLTSKNYNGGRCQYYDHRLQMFSCSMTTVNNILVSFKNPSEKLFNFLFSSHQIIADVNTIIIGCRC